MANARFSVTCPSCDADVPVRSTSAVGTKIECPKCKFRFVCPTAPDSDTPTKAGKETEDSAKGKEKKKSKKKGNSTVMVGAVLGVVAVAALAGAYMFLFSDDSGPAKPVNPPGGGGVAQVPPPPMPGDDEGMDDPMPMEFDEEGNPIPKEDPAEPKDDPDGEETPKKEKPEPKAPPRRIGPVSDVTNLLPGNTKSVLRLDMNQIPKTPLYAAMFDASVRAMFQESMTFAPGDLEYVYICEVDNEVPFVVIRSRAPIDEQTFLRRSNAEKAAESPLQGRYFFVIKSNPFLQAMYGAFSSEAISAAMGAPPTVSNRPEKTFAEERFAVHVRDDLTMLISTEEALTKYLRGLEANGYPEYQTEIIPESKEPEPKKPADGDDPVSSPGAEEEGAVDPGSAEIDPMNIPTGAPKAPKEDKRKLYTSIPTYRTIDPNLKRLINDIEQEHEDRPAILLVTQVDQRQVAARDLNQTAGQLGDPALSGVFNPVSMVGLTLTTLGREKIVANLTMELVEVDEARRVVSEMLYPAMQLLALPLGQSLGADITVRDQTAKGGQQPGRPGFGNPGFPGDDGYDDEGAYAEPEFGVAPGFPGPGGPGRPGDKKEKRKPSYIDMYASDRTVNVSLEIFWDEEKYDDNVYPKVVQTAAQFKGKMAVLSGERDWQALAPAVGQMATKTEFPKGTLQRQSNQTRMRLPYPPDQKVGFLAELLPYIGRGGLRAQIQDRTHAWYDDENQLAADTWVPEFLVPSYPPNAWRASHPKAPGRSLGGTNFVGLAGLGLDAARMNPSDPSHAKKAGITGYDWNSKVEDITDGTSNTIYMIQVPPTMSRPWIAGGGSTLVGVDDKGDDPFKPFVSPGPDGKRGAYVLMGDGSVRWIKEGVDPAVFRGMVTRAGGEDLGNLEEHAPTFKPGKQTELRSVPDQGAAR